MRLRGLLAVLLLVVAPARIAHADDAQATADEHFRRGRAQFMAREYAEAERSFEATLRLFVSPNARLYLARTQRELGRYDEAAESFEHAEADARRLASADPEYAKTAAVAHAELLLVSQRVGWISVVLLDERHARIEGSVRIGARAPVAVAAQPSRLAVMPGIAHLEAAVPGRAALAREVEVAAGDEKRVEIAWPAEATASVSAAPASVTGTPDRTSEDTPRRRSSPALVIAGFAIGGVGVLGFGALQLAAADRFSYLEEHGCRPPLSGECRSARDAGPRYETISVISLGVGLTSVAVAIYLLATR